MSPLLNFPSPAVQVQELDFSAYAKGPGATATGLIGVFEKGPIGVPTLILSLPEAQRKFGGFMAAHFGMHSVKQYFDQGGRELWIVRTAHYATISDKATLAAIKATKTLADRAGTPQNTLRVDALSEGVWGNGATGGLSVAVVDATVDVATGFRLQVFLNGSKVEDFDNLSMDAASKDYVETKINSRSEYVTVTNLASGNAAPNNRPALIAQGSGALSTGADGISGLVDNDFVGHAVAQNGLFAFDTNLTISLIVAPGRTGFTVANALVSYATNRKDLFAIIETPSGLDAVNAIAFRNQTTPYVGVIFDSSYGALYWPWLKQIDPVTGLVRGFPPSAAIAGMMTRSDSEVNPWGAAAGYNRGVLKQVAALESDMGQTQADSVFPSGINPIVRKDGVGFVVMGQQTLQRKPTATDRINVRRMLLTVGKTLKLMAEASLLFEPNIEITWATFKREATTYLNKVKDAKGLVEFKVICDSSNNPPASLDQNRLNVDIYLKPVKTAEFITLSIAFTSQGASFEELFATS